MKQYSILILALVAATSASAIREYVIKRNRPCTRSCVVERTVYQPVCRPAAGFSIGFGWPCSGFSLGWSTPCYNTYREVCAPRVTRRVYVDEPCYTRCYQTYDDYCDFDDEDFCY